MRTCAILLTICCMTSAANAQVMLTVNVDNATAFVGRLFGIRVYDRTTSTESIRFIEPSIDAGTISYTRNLLGLVIGHDYNVDVYFDMNGTGNYEPSSADVSWRRMFNAVGSDAVADFTASESSTEIDFPARQTELLHHVSKTYVGGWENYTYATEGQATGTSEVDYKQRTASLSMTTNGAFGIPAPITMNFTGTINASGDSADLAPEAPATGSLKLVRGVVSGLITLTSPPVSLELNGNYGDHQIMFTYVMSGAFTSNGLMTMVEATATGVEENTRTTIQAFPNPATEKVRITSSVPFATIHVYSMMGELLVSTLVDETLSSDVDVSQLPAGAYIVSTGLGQQRLYVLR